MASKWQLYVNYLTLVASETYNSYHHTKEGVSEKPILQDPACRAGRGGAAGPA